MAAASKECCNKKNGCSPVAKTQEPLVFNRELSPIVGCVPVGSQVLLELLTRQEIMNTKLVLNDNKPIENYQAFVVATGPTFSPEAWGFNVGDRVLISGLGTNVPSFHNGERSLSLMEPHSVKGVLLS